MQFTEWNESIDELNDLFEELKEAPEAPDDVVVDKLENIKNVFGFFGGVKYNLSNKSSIGVNYERFSPGTSANISSEIEDLSIDMKISIVTNALVAMYKSKINDFISIQGGAGYYAANAEFSVINEDNVELPDELESNTSKLTGIGYKVGAGFDYPMPDNENTNLFADLNYRILKLNDVDDADNTLNADGIELRAGISYKF